MPPYRGFGATEVVLWGGGPGRDVITVSVGGHGGDPRTVKWAESDLRGQGPKYGPGVIRSRGRSTSGTVGQQG